MAENKDIKVCVGLSGGVDSSVAALLLKQQGYDVFALFMQNWHDASTTLHGDCEWEEDRFVAELVARKIGIPFYFVDLSKEYRQRVVDYMFDEYEKGRTPNPDVLCNREIKFDAFLKCAKKLGADYVATGHYCRKETTEGPDGTVYRILAGTDPNKDQSYFLCQLTQKQLSYAMFPIGDLLKPEVRRIAEEQKLATAKRKDSQGICFVGKVDLPIFLQQKLAAKDGNIHEILPSWRGYGRVAEDADVEQLAQPYRYTVRDGKKIGTHRGAHFYTIGQRKGMGFGGGPWFVIKKDQANNILYVAHGYDPQTAYKQDFPVHDFHFLTEHELPENITFKIRHTPEYHKATVEKTGDGSYIIHSAEQIHGVAPGQFCVVYDSDHHRCYGSGEIMG